MTPAEIVREEPIAGQLTALSARRATGTLVIDGPPGGIAYLDDGFLAFAECPDAPDLGTRLIGSGRVPAQRWDQLIAGREDGAGLADLLIGPGLLTAAELRELLESVTFDALLALAMPLAGRGFRARTAFLPGPPHWAGPTLRLDVVRAWEYVEQEAARAQHAGNAITPGTRPLPLDLARGSAVLTGWEWTIACQASGQVTVGELARRNGLSLHETSYWVGRLVKAGLCAALEPADQPAEVTRSPLLPRRVPGAMIPARPLAAPVAESPEAPEPPDPGSAAPFQTPDLPLLRQILHGLKSLR